jgi:integrase
MRPPALRVSELLALTWTDLDFEDLVMYVRRAYVWRRFKVPKSKASKAPVPRVSATRFCNSMFLSQITASFWFWLSACVSALHDCRIGPNAEEFR